MKITKMIGIRSRLAQLAYVDYRLSEYVLGSIFRHIEVGNDGLCLDSRLDRQS